MQSCAVNHALKHSLAAHLAHPRSAAGGSYLLAVLSKDGLQAVESPDRAPAGPNRHLNYSSRLSAASAFLRASGMGRGDFGETDMYA